MNHTDIRRLRLFPARQVQTGGWIADQMRADLRSGFVGHLDRLAPDLVVEDDIFGRDRLTAAVQTKELGALSDDAPWTVMFLWWSAETQGNWRDGWVRHCLAVGDADEREAALAWIERILVTQDPDGYLGIYGPDLRFPQRGENGELWGQAVLLRALLGAHGHMGDTRVLAAVERAVARTMAAYPMPDPDAGAAGSHPFGLEPSFGGVSHGLMLVDVLWDLAGLTGDQRYLRYAEWLYRSFATAPYTRGDARAKDLLDPRRGFSSHGVHTYEQWRALTVATAWSEATGDGHELPYAELDAAYLAKLDAALTPSGAPNGDESCHAKGSAGQTGYEYCSIQELLHAYGRRVEVTGDTSLGDRMESLVFNVGMGARDPLEGGVAYLKTDDSLSMAGPEGFRKPTADGVPQTRYRYSPVHREAAVCCVPNAGRLLPTYARYQWLDASSGDQTVIIALLYGTSELRTQVDGVPLVVTQQTAYPGERSIRFTVEAGGTVDLALGLRVPGWAAGMEVAGVEPGRVSRDGSLLRVRGPWTGATVFEVRIEAEPEVRPTRSGGALVAHGPLLFALPLRGRREVGRIYEVRGVEAPFRDILVHPAARAPRPSLVAGVAPRVVAVPPGADAADAPHDWQRQALAVAVIDAAGGPGEAVLVPMGATVLRRLEFARA